MRLLLDTHAFLWFVLNDPQLSATALGLISDPANDVLISPASYWEIAIKVGLRKLDLHAPYDDFMQRGIVGNDFEILPIEPRHTSVLTSLPLHHRDPFDRLIVAQAMVENIPLVSADAVLDQYPINTPLVSHEYEGRGSERQAVLDQRNPGIDRPSGDFSDRFVRPAHFLDRAMPATRANRTRGSSPADAQEEFVMPEISTHPTSQALALFGHGKLPEAQASTVAAHLETCADCRSAVAGLPADSFLGKVRAARPGASSVPPGTSPARPGGAPSVLGKPTVPPAPPANVPPELANHPKFRIVRELGRGGMGVIYLAEHRVLEKLVALKVISPAVLDNPDALARFHAEVRAAGKLDHPNIARAFDADQAGDLHFLVMEYVEGLSLAQVVQRKGPLPLAHACHYARQAALGLQHASEKDMVHRDIKPQNLMLAPKNVVKVLDFGLARLRSERKGVVGLTQADAFMGTPEYVAPEQATDARTADTRADIYSLGCTLYALLTGRPPFQEDTLVKLVLAHIEKEPLPLHELRPEVPAELSAVVARMLAKDPARRYQQPVEVAQALVPFIKAGGKAGVAGGASLPPGVAAAGRGTMIGGDTSQVKGLGKAVTQPPAKVPPAKEVKEKESPFSDLSDAPAPPPAGKKGKKGHDRAKPVPAAWWKRPAVLAGAGAAVLALAVGAWLLVGVIFKTKVKTAAGEALVVLEIDQAGAEVLVDGQTIKVNVPGDGKPVEITIPPGKHTLQVKKGEFVAFTREMELSTGRSPPIKVRLEPVPPAPPRDSLDQWFAVGTRWEGKGAFTNRPEESWAWWFTVRSREGNKFKGRLIGEGRMDLAIEGTLGDDGKSFRWTNARHTPNVWMPEMAFASLTGEGKCMAERTRVDWKRTQLDGQILEGFCDFTTRRDGSRKDDEEVWPPPHYPRRAATAPAGKWSVQGGELVQEKFVADLNNSPVIVFGDLAWKDYDFHFKAMRTAGDHGFIVIFDKLRPTKQMEWHIGFPQGREMYLQIAEVLPTGFKPTPLSERKAVAIADNQWYDIRIKTRGQWIECFLDDVPAFKIAHPDRWGGKVGFTCLRMAGRFKDISVKAPDGKLLWEGPPELP